MGKRDPRIDVYIEKSPEFAKPILRHLRDVVHSACPEVEETMKWSSPFFDYKGPLCNMAGFKQHCAFGFWKGSLLAEDLSKSDEAAGHFGRIATLDDLPSKKELTAMIKKAARLNDEGVKAPKRAGKSAPKKAIPTPDDLSAALRKNKRAAATFETFTPSHKREYVEWITEAKMEETRKKRIDQAIQWMAEGKSRNWKYAKK